MAISTRKDLKAAYRSARREIFAELGWCSIETLHEQISLRVKHEIREALTREAERELIREICQEKNPDGLREVETVVTDLPDGTRQRMYKQLDLFSVADFKFVVAERSRGLIQDYQYILLLVERCQQMHSVQLTLPISLKTE